MKLIDDIRRENLARLKEEAGGLTALAQKLGKDDSQVSQWIQGSKNSATGKPRGMRSETARFIETAVGRPPGWLDLDHTETAFVVRESAPAYGARVGVPVVGTAKLGDDGHFCELEYPVGHGDGRIEWPSRDPGAYSLRCKGDSMKPRIRHGEFVVVEPNHPVLPGEEVLVRSRDGRVMVKQLAYIRDGMVYLDSVNEAHPRISIAQDQIEAFHYVAAIAKSALWKPD